MLASTILIICAIVISIGIYYTSTANRAYRIAYALLSAATLLGMVIGTIARAVIRGVFS